MLPNRPYDALYDATYSVSGARDHYRQQTRAGGFNIEKCPQYNNFFSELPHHPPYGFRYKTTDKVPGFVDRNFHPNETTPQEAAAKSELSQVSGPQRWRYFRRPLLAAPASNAYKTAPLQAKPATPSGPLPASKTCTTGTQSDYRESEAQTLPWDPEFKLPPPSIKQQVLSNKYSTNGPEVLTLKDMAFGDGLPVGLQEVQRIEKLRAKRAFEASLPPITDMDKLPLRQRMIEEWEKTEWIAREAEIEGVQEERLVLLEQAIQVREEENELKQSYRLGRMTQKAAEEKTGKFAQLQTRRVKAMRHFLEARRFVEKPRKLQKPSAVQQYASYGSAVYAPLQREGRFPDSKPLGQEIDTDAFQAVTTEEIVDLEQSLPARLLKARTAAPREPTKLSFNQRQDKAKLRDLTTISDLLDNAKSTLGRGYGDCWPCPLGTGETSTTQTLFQSTRAADRPPTPEAKPLPQDRHVVAAVVLLQALLRGRAVQTQMYEGRARRHELIGELKHGSTGQSARPEHRSELIEKLDKWLGQVFSTLTNIAIPHTPSKERMEALREITTRQFVGEGADSQQPFEARTSTASTSSYSEEQEKAVIKIQAVQRGRMARKRVQKVKQQYDQLESLQFTDEQEKAVIKIQAMQRGRMARKSVKDMRSNQQFSSDEYTDEHQQAVVRIQAMQRGRMARKKVQKIKDGQHQTQADVPSEYSEEQERAVVKIQALQRGRAARKKVQQIKHAQGQPESGTSEFSEEQERAVEKIQAVQRGRMARKSVQVMREQHQREDHDSPTSSGFTEEQEKAVVKIQAIQRGRIARKRVHQIKTQHARQSDHSTMDYSEEEQRAVVKIQAVQRGRMARKTVQGMRVADVEQAT